MMEITPELVSWLIGRQFPQWKQLAVYPVEKGGHDNRTFHVGEKLLARLPSAPEYEAAVKKEAACLPRLQRQLPFPIPAPIALGRPEEAYPLFWSVLDYLPGEALRDAEIGEEERLARDLAGFLRALQAADASFGPPAGAHSFQRGGNLAYYGEETRQALLSLDGRVDGDTLAKLWRRALASRRQGPPVWVHGDVAEGNLLVRDGRLYAMIDFGTSAVGDPACDYVMAWTYFQGKARDIFLEGCDRDTVDRARGWALWKALITYDSPEPAVRRLARSTVEAVLQEK